MWHYWRVVPANPDVSTVKVEQCYDPFTTTGYVSLKASESKCSSVPVKILCDTGAVQSFILEGVLPLSEKTDCGTYALCRGF